MPEFDTTMVAVAVLLFTGVIASKMSTRLGVPAVVLFLGVGMLAGSEGPGGIEFSDFERAQTIGVVALAFILFAGGLDTRWSTARSVLAPGVALATGGVLATAVVTGAVAGAVLDLSFREGLLLGAIVSSTDAAAVFSVLRSQRVGLRGRLRPLLELESGSNDPMAVFLTIGLMELVKEPGTSAVTLVPIFVQQMAIGAVAGYLLARLAVVVVNRLRLEIDGLYPVMTVAVVLLVYAGTAALGGSGFLAVYVAGITMGDREFLHKQSLMRFHDAVAWLMQIAMFLVLGLLVFPSDLAAVAASALLVSIVLVLVARPIGVFTSLAFASGLDGRDKLLLSWVGLRGAVPIVLATFPEVEGLGHADTIFNVVFFIVLTSVLLQGTTIPLVARWLHVDTPLERRRRPALAFDAPSRDGGRLHQLLVPHGSPAAFHQIVDLRLPAGSLIVLITRGDEYVIPQGATTLEPGDELLVLADDAGMARVQLIVSPPGVTDGD